MYFDVTGRIIGYSTLFAYIGFLYYKICHIFQQHRNVRWVSTLLTNVVFFSTVNQFMFAKATERKQGFSTLIRNL
jgi:hypothetical protein